MARTLSAQHLQWKKTTLEDDDHWEFPIEKKIQLILFFYR